MNRAWLAVLVLAAPTLACDKGNGTQPPDLTPPIAATGDSGSTEPAGSADPGQAPEDDPAEATSTDAPPADPPPPDDPPKDDPPKDDPAPVASSFQLPKPIHGNGNKSCGKDPGVGTQLKGFKLPTTQAGKTYSNASFRGQVMLVNFWGTWCKPCLKELPKFAQLYRRYRKHGMTLLAIATDEDAEVVKETLAKRKIAAKVAIGGEDYAGQYASEEFPFTFVVDHKGVIQASYFGYKAECMGQLEADIRTQLDKRATAKRK